MDFALLVLSVAIVGGVGSVVRHLASHWSGHLPWGTLLVNSVASFVAGAALATSFYELALIVGFAGGLSTFSSFAAQTHNMWGEGRTGPAVFYAFLNLGLPAVSLLTALTLL
jgi:fluoride exporter